MNNIMTVSTPNSWVLLDEKIRNINSVDLAIMINELTYNMLFNTSDDLDDILINIIKNYSIIHNFDLNDSTIKNLIMFVSELLNTIAYADMNILQRSIGITDVNKHYTVLVVKNV